MINKDFPRIVGGYRRESQGTVLRRKSNTTQKQTLAELAIMTFFGGKSDKLERVEQLGFEAVLVDVECSDSPLQG